MVVLDPVVRILLGVVNRLGDQLIDNAKQGRSQIGGDFSGPPVVAKGGGEEPCSGSDVTSFRHVHVNDLAVLIECSVHIAPDTGDLDVGLVHEPPVADTVTAGSRRVDE